MSSNVLLKEIREKGGAYGGGSRFNQNGVLSFFSYRDPHVLKTYEAFEKAIQWAVNGLMR
jgi:Zn-dependent M16 (insulinase) family peptidase